MLSQVDFPYKLPLKPFTLLYPKLTCVLFSPNNFFSLWNLKQYSYNSDSYKMLSVNYWLCCCLVLSTVFNKVIKVKQTCFPRFSVGDSIILQMNKMTKKPLNLTTIAKGDI